MQNSRVLRRPRKRRDLVQPYILSSMSGGTISILYVALSLKIDVLSLGYFSLGIVFFIFLVIYIFARIPVGIVSYSKYRNFVEPASFLLLAWSLYVFSNTSKITGIYFVSVLMGLSLSAAIVSINSKISEDFSSSSIRISRRNALALGTLSAPVGLLITSFYGIHYAGIINLIEYIALFFGTLFLFIEIYRFFVRKIKPKQDPLFVTVNKSLAPLKMLGKIRGKAFFLATILIDILFIFAAWSILIYLPYYSYTLINSAKSSFLIFAGIALSYVIFRFAGQHIRSRKFFISSYFVRSAVFIIAFLILSLAVSVIDLFLALLILSSVGLFEEGAKNYVYSAFDSSDQQIVKRSSQILVLPFIVLAPLFSYEFFSISFSLGFASAIIPAAISLLLTTFLISNPKITKQ